MESRLIIRPRHDVLKLTGTLERSRGGHVDGRLTR